jgi:predicted DsbA family dithiol-disulfide isomerase
MWSSITINRDGLPSRLGRHASLLVLVKRGARDAADVRAQQMKYTSMGIHSVPSIIINDKYLLQGAQPAEAFEEALRQVAAET